MHRLLLLLTLHIGFFVRYPIMTVSTLGGKCLHVLSESSLDQREGDKDFFKKKYRKETRVGDSLGSALSLSLSLFLSLSLSLFLVRSTV